MEKTYTTSSKNTFNGKILKIYEDEINLEHNGNITREYVKHIGAATILPVINNKIFFVKQYRHPIEQHLLELPAGTLNRGEDPKLCAIREVEEEIGYKAKDIQFMFKTSVAPGYSSEIIYVYLATDLEKTQQNLDADEFLEIESYTLEEALQFIKDGTIIDAKTISALLYYKEFCL